MILLQFLLVLVDTIGISSLFTQEIIWKTSEKVFGATDKDISIRLPLSSEGIPEVSVRGLFLQQIYSKGHSYLQKY